MFRYLRLNRKGQFFIISAVIIVSALFSVYAVYLGYYEIDGSIIQSLDSTYRLDNIVDRSQELHERYEDSSCFDIRNVLSDYKRFVEKTASESGDFVKYRYDSRRGCIQTDFNILVKTRNSEVSKEFTMNVPHTKHFWNMSDCTGFNDNIHETENVTCVDNRLVLSDGYDTGEITYQFNPGSVVIWYENKHRISGTDYVDISWYDDRNKRYNSFNDLPEEFQIIKQEIKFNGRLGDGSSPAVLYSNTTYSTRP